MRVSLAEVLAAELVLGDALGLLRAREGGYQFVDHWQQGEFHHDVVVRVPSCIDEAWLVIATNCNGGIKEVLAFAEPPDRLALWHWRCPNVAEFASPASATSTGSPKAACALPPIVARAQTLHWFSPCELLDADARSELRPEFRERQLGGGWQLRAGCAARRGDAK